MPLYEYECDACGQRFEVIQKFSDPAPDACAKCGKGPVHRLLSSPAIQFKGSGWYITDYAQKDKASAATKGKSDTGKTDSAGESKGESTAAKDSSSKSDTSAATGTTSGTDKS